MCPPEKGQTIPGFREAFEAQRKGFAEVEKIVYAEKCVWLPRLSIQERLLLFSQLFELGMTFRAHPGPIPELEALHIEETVAIRQVFARIAGHRPPA